jgi:Arabinose efflux permease
MASAPETRRGAPRSDQLTLNRHPGFLRLWAGETVSQFGAQLAQLAIPVLAVTLLGATEWQVGLLNAAETAAFLVIGLPVGAWVDRMRKRRVMIVADLVRAAALATIPFLWAAGMLQIWHVYAVAVAVGAATVFFDVSYQSFIPVLVRDDLVAGANGRLEASAQIARIGGPAIGGALLAIVSAPFVLAGTSVGYLVSWMFLLWVRVHEMPPPRAERRPLWREIGEGLAFVWGHRLIRRISFTTATANFFGAVTVTLLPVLVLRTLGLAPALFGIVMSFGAVGGVLGAAATPWLTRRIGEGSVIPFAAVIFGAAGFTIPLAAVFPVVAIPLLVGGELLSSFGVLVYNVAQLTFRQRACPPALLGRMNASIRCLVWGVMPIGSLIAGALGQAFGITVTMWVGALGGLIAVALVLVSPLSGMRVLPSSHAGNGEGVDGGSGA